MELQRHYCNMKFQRHYCNMKLQRHYYNVKLRQLQLTESLQQSECKFAKRFLSLWSWLIYIQYELLILENERSKGKLMSLKTAPRGGSNQFAACDIPGKNIWMRLLILKKMFQNPISTPTQVYFKHLPIVMLCGTMSVWFQFWILRSTPTPSNEL